MEYMTVAGFENFMQIWRLYLQVLFVIVTFVGISSITVEIVKIYTFKEDRREIFKSIFNILKTLTYLLSGGVITMLVTLAYEGENIDIIFKGLFVVVLIISMLICFIYRKYFLIKVDDKLITENKVIDDEVVNNEIADDNKDTLEDK